MKKLLQIDVKQRIENKDEAGGFFLNTHYKIYS